ADFVIATGRDYSSMKDIMKEHHLSCMAILGNGAQFVDRQGKLLSSAYFPKKHFKDVVQIFDDLHIHYMIFTDQGPFSIHDPLVVRDAFLERCCVQFHRTIGDYDGETNMPCMHLKHIENVDDFLKSEIHIIKVEAFSIDVDLIAQAKEKLSCIADIAYLSSFNDNVEVTDQHAQKGLILEEVIKKLGIEKDEVMVLGDGFNDLTLFERFPFSFAPENAEDGIKKLAYKIVSSCEENGVADAIYTMIPKGN
ncbi:MAG: HAD hydrolase family protein, partial [Faecalibacillus sp.]